MNVQLPPLEEWVKHAGSEVEDNPTADRVTLAIIAHTEPEDLTLINMFGIRVEDTPEGVDFLVVTEERHVMGVDRVQSMRRKLAVSSFIVGMVVSSWVGIVTADVAERNFERIALAEEDVGPSAIETEYDGPADEIVGFLGFVGGFAVTNNLHSRGTPRRTKKKAKRILEGF